MDDLLEDSAYIEGSSIERLNLPCTCKPLVASRNKVKLLRKRFLSLFLWPEFLSSVEFGKEQENAILAPPKPDRFLDSQGFKENRQRKRRNTNPAREPRKRRKRNDPLNEVDNEQVLNLETESGPIREPRKKRKLNESSNEVFPSEPEARHNLVTVPDTIDSQESERPQKKEDSSPVKITRKKRILNKSSNELPPDEPEARHNLDAEFGLQGSKSPQKKKGSSPVKITRKKCILNKSSNELSPDEQEARHNLDAECGPQGSKSPQKKKGSSPVKITRKKRILNKSSNELSPDEPEARHNLDAEFGPQGSKSPQKKKGSSPVKITRKKRIPNKSSNELSPNEPEARHNLDAEFGPQGSKSPQKKKGSSPVKITRNKQILNKSSSELSPDEPEARHNLDTEFGPQGSKSPQKKKDSNPVKVVRKKRKLKELSNEADNPEQRCNIDPETEPSLKQKQTELETDYSGETSQDPIRRSHRSAVLKRTSFAFLNSKNNKSVLKTSQKLAPEKPASQTMSSSNDNLLQIPEDRLEPPSPVPERINKRKNRKSERKASHDLAREVTSDSVMPSVEKMSTSFQMSGKDVCDASSELERIKANLKFVSVVVEKIPVEILPSIGIINNCSEENESDNISSISEKKSRRKSGKFAQRSSQELSVSEIVSQDMSPSADTVSSELQAENVFGVLSQPEKKNKRKSHKPKPNQESSVSEIISQDMSPSADTVSSELQAENVFGVLSQPEKKNKRRSHKPTPKPNQESLVSEIISHDISPTYSESNVSSLLHEENISSALPLSKRKTRSCKSATKTNDDSKPTPKHNQEPSVSEIISQDTLPSADTVSSELQAENVFGVLSQPEKKNKRKSHKPTPKPNQESSVSEITLQDMSPSADTISSELQAENVFGVFSQPEKKNKRRSHKPTPKPNQESSVSEIISHDISPTDSEINVSSLLHEENIYSALPLSKRKTRSCKSATKTNDESPASEIILETKSLKTEKNNSSAQVPEGSKCIIVTLRKSTAETSHDEASILENNSSSLPKEIKSEVSSIPEKNNRLRSHEPLIPESNSSLLLEENKPEISPRSEKNNRLRNHKLQLKTHKELSVIEIVSLDKPSSTDGIDNFSQLPDENKCEVLSPPEKENGLHKLPLKTNKELSVIEVVQLDKPPSNLSHLREETTSMNDVAILPEKRNTRNSCKSTENTSHKSSVKEIILDNKLNTSTGAQAESQAVSERNKRKSHKPIQKTNHDSSDFEFMSVPISRLENKEKEKVNTVPEIPNVSSDKVIEGDNTNDAIILLESPKAKTTTPFQNEDQDNVNDISISSSSSDDVEILSPDSSICELPTEKDDSLVQSLYYIEDDFEIQMSSSFSAPDDNRDVPSESEISQPDSVMVLSGDESINSPLPFEFQDRSSDGIEVIEERSTEEPEEVTISSDSSRSGDLPCDVDVSSEQKNAADCVLELSEENMCLK